jgi:uncharacterized protein YbjT (DUF2867 family)
MSNTHPHRILVLGSTGTIGRQVARRLLEAGEVVRVGARTPSKAEGLGSRGAQVVHFDFDDPETWGAALADAERVFVVAPTAPKFATPVGAFLTAAIAAGVGHVVRLSAAFASHDNPVGLSQQHAVADNTLAASGLSHTILQPIFFMDNAINFQGHSIRTDGAFYGASAGGSISYVSSGDIAEVAVAALTDPERHNGQTYVLTGGKAVTDANVAALIGAQLGKAVSYVDLPADRLAAGLRENGTPEWMVETLVAFEKGKAQGLAAPVSTHVAQVLGRPPETYPAFLARTASRWT